MTQPDVPLGPDAVPDKVLEELLVAFSGQPVDSAAHEEIDFDDPSIDRLLGIAPSAHEPVAAVTPVTPVVPVLPIVADTGPHNAIVPEPDGEIEGLRTLVDAAIVTQPVPEMPAPAPADPEPVPDTSVKPPRAPIKIGGNDDFVDPVYLDEEGGERLRGAGRATEASIERTTILIGDDEIEGSAGGIPIATGSMDPRLRARRIAVKRAIGRKRLKWVTIVAGVVIVITGVLALLGSSLFAVRKDQIAVSGAHFMSQTDLQSAIDELANHPVLLIDTHKIEAQLEKSPWVRDARVTTDFPHGASIEIVERNPVATYEGSDGKFRIMDADGVVVLVLAGRPLEFMLVNGPQPNAEPGSYVGDKLEHAAQVVEALSPAVRSRTAEVDVSDAGELSLKFHTTDTEVILGAPEDLLDKLTRLEAVLQRPDSSTLKRIDVSTHNVTLE